MNNELLDYDHKPKKRHRITAVATELIIIAILSLYLGSLTSVALAFFGLSLFYLLFGWYLFKSETFSTKNTLITFLSGIHLNLLSLGFLGMLNGYSKGRTMVTVGIALGVVLIIGLIIRYFKRKNEPLEYRFSLKLLSRIILFVIFYGKILSA